MHDALPRPWLGLLELMVQNHHAYVDLPNTIFIYMD